MVPLTGFIQTPGGSAPATTLQDVWPTTPLALADPWYGAPTCAADGAETDTRSGGGRTTMATFASATMPGQFASVARIENCDVPMVVGTPSIAPVASSDSPTGSEPAINDHDAAPVPPDAASAT